MAIWHGEPYPGFFEERKNFTTELFSPLSPPDAPPEADNNFWMSAHINAFIDVHARFPNKEEMLAIKEEHEPKRATGKYVLGDEDFSIEFEVKLEGLEGLTQAEWDAMYMQQPVSVGYKVELDQIEQNFVVPEVEWMAAVEDAVKSSFVLPSALLSPKGANEYNTTSQFI